jgi:hypothetical protein
LWRRNSGIRACRALQGVRKSTASGAVFLPLFIVVCCHFYFKRGVFSCAFFDCINASGDVSLLLLLLLLLLLCRFF